MEVVADTDITRIMLADDQSIIRAGLKALIETEPDLVVVAQSEDGNSTLSELRGANADVLVIDLDMPKPSGPELICMVRNLYPQLPLLVVSVHENPNIISAAMKSGANGYITKNANPEKLRQAIRRVAQQETWLSRDLMDTLLCGKKLAPKLSQREIDVLKLIAKGYRNHQIAKSLYISEKTVSTHKTNLLTKLELKTAADLIRYADENLLDL